MARELRAASRCGHQAEAASDLTAWRWRQPISCPGAHSAEALGANATSAAEASQSAASYRLLNGDGNEAVADNQRQSPIWKPLTNNAP